MDNYSSSLAFLGGFLFVLAVLGIIMYVFMALGMYTMAKKLSIENPWMAWIPIANAYILGKIAGDKITIFNNDIPKLGLVLLAGGIGSAILSGIPVIGFLIVIAYAVVSYVALYKIYRIFTVNSAVLYLVLSIVLCFTSPFLIFFASKNEPNLEIFNEGNPAG
jgi:hypothetical protein